MKLIVGLGNPGKQYERTPHNVGFDVVDNLARELECSLRKNIWFNAEMAKAVLGPEQVVLLKPLTFMNRSGSAVSAVMRWHKLGPEDLVVVLDDADLELGRLRIRVKGSSGGHKGLASVISCAGSEEFVRVRLGIGRSREGGDLVDRVLSPFAGDEQRKMDDVIGNATQAVKRIVESGASAAMNSFNK